VSTLDDWHRRQVQKLVDEVARLMRENESLRAEVENLRRTERNNRYSGYPYPFGPRPPFYGR
jgi:hypothetical protein